MDLKVTGGEVRTESSRSLKTRISRRWEEGTSQGEWWWGSEKRLGLSFDCKGGTRESDFREVRLLGFPNESS